VPVTGPEGEATLLTAHYASAMAFADYELEWLPLSASKASSASTRSGASPITSQRLSTAISSSVTGSRGRARLRRGPRKSRPNSFSVLFRERLVFHFMLAVRRPGFHHTVAYDTKCNFAATYRVQRQS